MSYNLILNNIELTNFRGFKETVSIGFDEHLTVFIGDNGSGKSSVLDAIANHLMNLRYEITNREMFDFPIPLDSKKNRNYDVKNDCEELENKATFTLTFLHEQKERTEKVSPILRAKKNTPTIHENWEDDEMGNVFFDYLNEINKEKAEQTLNNIPIMVYYGSASINTNIDIKEMEAGFVQMEIFDTYYESLESQTFNFTQFMILFDRQHKIILRRPTDEYNFTPFLEKAITEILSDKDGYTYKNFRIEWYRLYDEILIDKIDKNGNIEIIHLNQLSSGEKNLLALVGDLARRLYLANPNADNPLHGNGIVLIDEIDVHLHPKWQQKVVTKLREVFPNVQFVVTTHSALVISDYNIKPEQVLVLTEEEETQKKTILSLAELQLNNSGVEPNKIYEDIMLIPLRSEKAQMKMDKLSKLLNPLDFEKPETQALIQELTERFGTEDSFIRKINHHLKLLNRRKVVA